MRTLPYWTYSRQIATSVDRWTGCLFCGNTEGRFESEEHIIPAALGNSLKLVQAEDFLRRDVPIDYQPDFAEAKRKFDGRLRWRCEGCKADGAKLTKTTWARHNARIYTLLPRGGDHWRAALRAALMLRRNHVEAVFSQLKRRGVGDRSHHRAKWATHQIHIEWLINMTRVVAAVTDDVFIQAGKPLVVLLRPRVATLLGLNGVDVYLGPFPIGGRCGHPDIRGHALLIRNYRAGFMATGQLALLGAGVEVILAVLNVWVSADCGIAAVGVLTFMASLDSISNALRKKPETPTYHGSDAWHLRELRRNPRHQPPSTPTAADMRRKYQGKVLGL